MLGVMTVEDKVEGKEVELEVEENLKMEIDRE